MLLCAVMYGGHAGAHACPALSCHAPGIISGLRSWGMSTLLQARESLPQSRSFSAVFVRRLATTLLAGMGEHPLFMAWSLH